MWTQWLNGVLGLWIIISSFIGFTPSGMATNLVIVGIIVAVLGFLGAAQYQSQGNREQQRHQHV